MNGQENSSEIFEGATTAEYWEYDSRLGRRWNVDPIDQISISNYACFANSPIYVTDAAGSNTNTPISNPETGDKVGGATYNGENWDLNEVKITPTISAEVTKREAELNSPIRHFEPTAWQKNMYKSMDQFEKGVVVTGVALPAAVVAVETGFAYWLLRTSVIATLEELAGLPSPGGWGRKQVVKQVEKKVVKEAVKETVKEADPFDLIPTHSVNVKSARYKKVKLLLQTEESVKNETIKYVEHNGKKYVVDGHHRLRASKELGLESVPVEEVSLPYLGYKTVDDLQYTHQ